MWSNLEETIGYTFQNKSLLETALTHSSYANEHGTESNERLEFLGDAVLGLSAARFLYSLYGSKQEGELTRIRADLVCEKNLAKVAAQIRLGEYLRLGHGEETGGRTRPSTTSDAMEAVIAAVYLDGGLEEAYALVERLILSDDSALHDTDYKTLFQELVQRKKDQAISYEMTGESGPDHNKCFRADVLLNGSVAGSGTGHSKKAAEQEAAKAAIALLFPEDI